MPCEHLQELFSLCEKHDLKIASQDAIKVVCRQCEQQESCPTSLTDGDQVLAMPKTESGRDRDAEPSAETR